MSALAGLRPRPRSALMFWGFVVLMLALTVLFVALGKWQLDRLAWKEGLIAEVDARMHLPPVTLPPVAEWVGFDPQSYQFRPLAVTGHFVNAQSVRVFTSLGDARGQYSGPGYWIMTPFAIDGGGSVFVDRGFVPERLGLAFSPDKSGPEGTRTITGIGIADEEASAFSPGADGPNRIEWVRNVGRLATLVDPALKPFADIYIDLPAGPPGTLPQGGETTVDFPNNHLGYAWTWFGFAIVTPVMLAAWIFRERRRQRPAS